MPGGCPGPMMPLPLTEGGIGTGGGENCPGTGGGGVKEGKGDGLGWSGGTGR